jgi:hypothetical protein
MNAKIAASAAASLAFIAGLFITSLATARLASAQSWACYGRSPNCIYAQRYDRAPPDGYCGAYTGYCGAYEGPWRYHGGPHPSTGHL